MKQNGKTLSKEKKQKSDDDMSISTYDSDEDKGKIEKILFTIQYSHALLLLYYSFSEYLIFTQ